MKQLYSIILFSLNNNASNHWHVVSDHPGGKEVEARWATPLEGKLDPELNVTLQPTLETSVTWLYSREQYFPRAGVFANI
jgi:hypothetical protein